MTTIIEKKSEELGITVYQCKRCEFLGDEEGHVCDDIKRSNELRKQVYDNSIPIIDRLKIQQELDDLEKEIHDKDISRMQTVFPDSVYAKVVREALLQILANTERQRSRIYEENDAMRAKGVSFADRKKYLDSVTEKIRWCDKECERLARTVDNFTLVPYAEWMQPGDIDCLRRIGYRKFISEYGVRMGWCYKVLN